LKLVQARELLRLVAVHGDVECAGRLIAGRMPARSLDLGGERGVQARGGEVQGEQRLLTEVGLRHRREHPGRDASRRAAGLARVEHEHAQAALRGPPGDRETDHAGSDDEEVVPLHGFSRFGHRHRFGRAAAVTPTFLRRHYPDQVLRSAATSRPLSPVRRAPVARRILEA
jgi:hypothetical protein